ncbi:MAG TPA: MFS transporter, partial [Dehalococcoidia bacterium]|nr:MFS transporter [Dehalococcoidia bacterium]
FLVAGSIFAAGALLGGVAPSMPVLVIARATQGFGAGGLFAVGYGAIGRQLPAPLQPHGFGLLSATWGASSILGPAVGAAFIATIGWRWVFWFNLPVMVIILPAARAAYSGVRAAPRSVATTNVRGPVMLGLMAAAALVTLNSRGIWTLPLVLLTAIAAILFTWEERTSDRPVVAALRRPASLGAGAVIASCLTGTAMVSVQAYLPLFLQAGRGAPVIVAGGILATGSVVWTAGSMVSARLIAHGTRWLLAAGHVSFAIGCSSLIGAIALHLPLAYFYLGYMVAGLGIGLVTPSLFTIGLRDAARGSEGSATAAVQALRALGGGLGAGIAGLAFRLSVPQQLFDLLSDADPAAAIRGQGLVGFMDTALVACWLASLVAIALSAFVVLRLPGIRSQAPTVGMAL